MSTAKKNWRIMDTQQAVVGFEFRHCLANQMGLLSEL